MTCRDRRYDNIYYSPNMIRTHKVTRDQLLHKPIEADLKARSTDLNASMKSVGL